MPSGLYVLGSRAGERRNGMTINWATQVSFDPKLVAVSVEHEAFTHELVSEGGVFSLNLVSQEDRAIVRKFTKPVDVDLAAHTLNGFPYHDGTTGAPILDQAVAYLDCEVRQTVDVGSHTLFLGEIVDRCLPTRRGHTGARDARHAHELRRLTAAPGTLRPSETCADGGHSMLESTMQDFPLTVGMIFRHGCTVHGESQVVTFEGDHTRRASFAEVGARPSGWRWRCATSGSSRATGSAPSRGTPRSTSRRTSGSRASARSCTRSTSASSPSNSSTS